MSALLILIVCLCVHLVSGHCPRGCGCTGSPTTVSCSSLRDWPDKFPLTMSRLTISYPNITTLPSDTLLKYKKLKNIEFQYGSIGRIANSAFREIPAQYITFSYTKIGTIESGAFRDIDDYFKQACIRFQNGEVKTINPYAFYNLTGLNQLYINRMKIQSIEPHAFNKIFHSHYFSISYSNITYLKNNALDLHPKSFATQTLSRSSVMFIGHNTLEKLSNVEYLTTWCNCDVLKLIRKGAVLTGPLGCFPDNQIDDNGYDVMQQCEAPAIPPPDKLETSTETEDAKTHYRKKIGTGNGDCTDLKSKGFKDALSCLKVNLNTMKENFGLNFGLQMTAK